MFEERQIVKKVDRAKQQKELEKELEEEAAPLMEELAITKDEAMLYIQAKRRSERTAERMKQMQEGFSKFQDFCDMRVEPSGAIIKKKGGLKDGKEKK